MMNVFYSISVKKKLLTPVALLLFVLALVVFLFFKNQAQIDEARQDISDSSLLMKSISKMATDTEMFILTQQGYDSLLATYETLENKVKSDSDDDMRRFGDSISTAKQRVKEIQSLFEQNQALQEQMVDVTTASMRESNEFILTVSERLSNEETRSQVTTFEGSVIEAALLHTNNNYKVRLLFNELVNNPDKAQELIGFIDDLDAASDRALPQLEGTPMYENALAARRANAEVRKISNAFISNSEKISTLRENIEQSLSSTVEQLSNWTDTTIDYTFDSVGNSMLQIIAIIIAAVLIVIILSLVIATAITGPLRILHDHINELARKGGDLTYRIRLRSEDEIGQLAGGINSFLEALQTIFKDVADTGKQMSEQASEALSRSQRSQHHIENQQAESQKVASSFDEMESAIQNIASSTANAAEKVRETDRSTNEVVSAIALTIGNINSVKEKLDNATDVIQALNQDSKNIGGILDVIRAIAEQTNLLALNAAIEAARAGEQGRGFAVVADEVRSLAQRTQSSIEEINAMISKLQSAAGKASTVIEEGNQQIGITVENSQRTEANIELISQLVSAISEMNLQIASATEEQSAVAQQVNQSVSQITSLAQRGSNAAKDASDAASLQEASSKKLLTVINKFTV